MACGCNGAITNGGAKLIDRARNENKALVFSAVRMNTVYENSIMELVQKSESWFGANVGEVVGCLSHIIIDDVSHVCDAKVAVQCNDNAKAWKTIGIYGHLEGESNDTLIYCESIQNGDFKGTTVVELPVTLDGAVEDFGLSEGGGGGGDIPAEQSLWAWEGYIGGGTEDEPQDGDKKYSERVSIGIDSNPLTIERDEWTYDGKDDSWSQFTNTRLNVTQREVDFNGLTATWANIIKAARNEQGFDRVSVTEEGGSIFIGSEQVKPNSEIKIEPYVSLVIDSNGDIESIHSTGGNVLDVSVAVYDNGSVHRVSGIISEDSSLSFESPITPGEGQVIFIHWSHYVD